MKFVDTTTNPDRIPDDVRPLIRGMLLNRQLLGTDHDGDPVTEALKYTKDDQKRRLTTPYTGDDSFINKITALFDFDPLDFQLDSWQLIDDLHDRRQGTGEPHAAILSAPTSFGKTEAFLGPLYQHLIDGEQDTVVIVYPRRALLQDQLGRILEHIHTIRETGTSPPTVGVYMGGMPYRIGDVREDYFETSAGQETFTLAHCWCGGDDTTNAFGYDGGSNSYTIRCEANDDHAFTNNELVLSRTRIVNGSTPDILLTTLESLELFALKPNYDIIHDVDTIVLDEVHLYTRLRGAHAAKIIDNINDITAGPLLWLGASATIDNADRFISKLFDFPSNHLATVDVPESDLKKDHDDEEHFYFLLSPEDGPGASSMMIQQLLLIGHGLLRDNNGNEGKVLSFIDSISQVNQKKAQLDDAERGDPSQNEPPLWHHHTVQSTQGQQPVTDEADWVEISRQMDSDFINERALEFLPVYSEIGFDAEDAAASDIFLSTSFLEVGIDIGEIKHVTQYRTPQNLSSFVQRTGRAAREEGMDSHIFVYLSNLTNDANMFYRADRFLASELRTPLKPDNEVIEWIHTMLNDYYQRASDIDERRIRRGEEQTFLEEFLTQDKNYREFYQFLTNPSDFLLAEFDIDENLSSLTTENGIKSFRHILNEQETALEEEFEEVDELIDIDSGEITRSENAFEQYVDEVRQRTLEAINHYIAIIDHFRELLDEHEAPYLVDNLNELEERLDDLRTRTRDRYTGDETERVEQYELLFGDIIGAVGDLTGLRGQVNVHVDSRPDDVSLDRITNLRDAVDILSSIAGDGRLEENIDERYQIYYLRRVLDQLAEYRDLDREADNRVSRPYMSVYYVKYLFRAAYYFHRYLEITDRDFEDEIWYVPPSYFDSSGQFFTVIDPDGLDHNEETIDTIVHSNAPYRSEFQSGATSLHVFLPQTEVVDYGTNPENNTVQFDFGGIPGDRRNGMIIPDSIQLSEIPDVTDRKALNIVAYCPQCLTLLDNQRCAEHNEITFGKIHADPQVRTVARDVENEENTGHLALSRLRGQVTLEGVTLDITPAQPMGDLGIRFSDAPRIQREIQSPDTPLGFDLQTRGLIYHLADFIEHVEDSDDLLMAVSRYKNLDEIEIDELAYHTAAHLFLHVVADVGGVNPSMLFYGLDPEDGIIFIFERTEGGQGIVDLVYEELENDPGTILESLIRTTYNTQVINEQLWSDPDFVDDLPDHDISDAEAERCVDTHLDRYFDVVFPEIRDDVVQEVLSTCDRAAQLREEEAITLRDAYTVKHTVSDAQIAGVNGFPEDQVEALSLDLDELPRVESLFYSPDIDGCVENLHTAECISGHDQEEVLSHVLLQELRSHLLDYVPKDKAADEMFDREQIPAGEVNDTSIYLTF